MLIDTDKYKGHTEGPWKWDKWGVLQGEESVLWCNFTEPDPNWQLNNSAIHVSEADEELIADAPLLLAEVKRLQALIRSKGLCTNCGQSHEGIEVVMDYSEDEVGHRISKECIDTCHPNLSTDCCDLCLCLNGFTIEHDYWEMKKND